MWCSACQQDVPALADSSGGGETRCARCHGLIHAGHPATTGEELTENDFIEQAPNDAPPMLPGDQWQLDEELREVRRMLRVLKVSPLAGNGNATQTALADGPAI